MTRRSLGEEGLALALGVVVFRSGSASLWHRAILDPGETPRLSYLY